MCQVADDLPDDDEGKEAYAKKYIEEVARAGQLLNTNTPSSVQDKIQLVSHPV